MRGITHIALLIPLFTLILITTVLIKERGTSEGQKFPLPFSLDRSTNGASLEQQSQITGQIAPPSPLETPTPTSSPSPENSIETSIVAQKALSPSPAPKPASTAGGAVVSGGGNYTVATYPIGGVTVVTDSASDDDCSNNCSAKPLAQYVSENGGRGGINGTYFCPPDYGWCSNKVNTYDFPIWNNRKRKWMQADKLFWGGRGMMVFRGGSPQFFVDAGSSGAPGGITGGIVNYPSLLAGGNDVLNEGALSDNLKVTKGTRSAIGFGSGKIFLVVARNANMRDLVNIFKSLGATDALNLDGGGSSALYDGGYKAGPGRALPNALVVK